jgi:hypothetical protein
MLVLTSRVVIRLYFLTDSRTLSTSTIKSTTRESKSRTRKIIKEPRGFAVGPADRIFVCTQDTNSIVQISHAEKILSSHVLDMELPLSVCVSKDNARLAVSNSCMGKMNLQLYNIELMYLYQKDKLFLIFKNV